MSSLPPPPLYNSGATSSTPSNAPFPPPVKFSDLHSVLGPSFTLEKYSPRNPLLLCLKSSLDKTPPPAPSVKSAGSTPLSKPLSFSTISTLENTLQISSAEERVFSTLIKPELDSLTNPIDPSNVDSISVENCNQELSRFNLDLEAVTLLKNDLESSKLDVTKVINLLRSLSGTSSPSQPNLHTQIQTLVISTSSLETHLSELKTPITFYSNIDNSLKVLGIGDSSVCVGKDEEGNDMIGKVDKGGKEDDIKIHLGSEEFGDTLVKLKSSLRFFEANKELHSSKLYILRAEYMLKLSYTILKNGIAQRIEKVVNEITKSSGGKIPSVKVEKIESSILYTKWMGIGSRIKSFFDFVVEGGGEIKGECFTEYMSWRLYSIQNSIKSYSEDITKMDVISGVRVGVGGLRRLERMERGVWGEFFGDEGVLERGDFLGRLFAPIWNGLRRGVIKANSSTVLCSVINILQSEINLSKPEETSKNDTLSRVMSDAQERVVFLIRREIKRSVKEYKPSKDDIKPVGSMLGVEGEVGGSDVYESWYPPLKNTLFVLSKIFRVVGDEVFDDIAREAVEGCVESFERAKGLEEKLESKLFLVANLLTLREQLTPFSLELRQVDKALHFSSTSDAIRTFVSNRSSLFDLSGNNALLNFANDVVPKVEETEVDKKEELDGILRRVCNQLCEEIGEKVLGDSITVKPPTVEKLQEAKIRVSEYLGGEVLESFKVYLDENTVMILMKPIQRKVVKAYQDLKVEGEEMKGVVEGIIEAVKKI
ncbi:hypothetical protein TL16_g10511, partial [Triparma laevis f. inornata]